MRTDRYKPDEDRQSSVSKAPSEVHSIASLTQDQTVRLYQRLWSGYTKFIRSQCNKDRLVDSLLFGCFFKRVEAKQDEAAEDKIGNN